MIEENLKKHDNAPIRPPFPPMTRARVVAAAMLSSSMPLSTPCTLNYSTSYYILSPSGHHGAVSPCLTPHSLACSPQPPHPTFSCSYPSIPEVKFSTQSSDSKKGSHSHNYLLRSLSPSQPLDSIGIGIIPPSHPSETSSG